MTMIAADRARFLELMMELGPDASHFAVLGFVRQHLDAARAEMGARPGMDRVRAGLWRLLPELDVDAAAWRHEALVALQAYGEDVADPDPAGRPRPSGKISISSRATVSGSTTRPIPKWSGAGTSVDAQASRGRQTARQLSFRTMYPTSW